MSLSNDSTISPVTQTSSSNVLFDNDNIRQFNPQFAKAVGLNVAILCQQVHYWSKINQAAGKTDHYHEGRWWVYNTYTQWQAEFPWWSKSTVERAFREGREAGVILARPIYQDGAIVSMWYTVDREKCNQLMQDPPRQNDKTPHVKMTRGSRQNGIVTKTTQKTTAKKDIPATADATPATTFDDFSPMDWSKAPSRQGRMVQVVYQVWGYPVGSARNTMMEQMLRGVSTNDQYKIGNLPTTHTKRFEPEELGDWHDWYMQSGVQGNDKVITESPMKVQASIMQWIDAGKPKGKSGANPLSGFQEVI
jgi:hypothetical protein